MMVEDKGPGYAALLKTPFGPKSLAEQWLDQSERQLEASNGRKITWYFAEQEAADFARKTFEEAGDGRQNIDIEVVPWSGGNIK